MPSIASKPDEIRRKNHGETTSPAHQIAGLRPQDHRRCCRKIVEVANKTGAKVIGPVPLPTEKQVYTILRATFKYKDSREQFEIRTHKRLIDIVNPTKETVEAIRKLDLPNGVDIDVTAK